VTNVIFYGDSWCYSYIKTKSGRKTQDRIEGLSIPEMLGKECYAKRRVNNYEILNQINQYPCIVFQTDPLRDAFIPWNSFRKPIRRYFAEEFYTDQEFDLMDVAKDRLDLFYSKLSGKDVVLFSGASKVDVELAKKHNLQYIEKSATEILIDNYEDTPFFDYKYTIETDQYLRNNFLNYKSKKSILDEVGKKNLVWLENSDLFTRAHAKEKGNFIIAKYIAKSLELDYSQV